MTQTAPHAYNRLRSKEPGVPDSGKPEMDLDTIMKYTQMLEYIHPDKVVIICRYEHGNAHHISENCKDFWGIPAKQMKYLTTEQYLDLVHPDDISCLHKIQRFIEKYESTEDPTQTRFHMLFRMKGPDGTYRVLETEKIVLKTANGNLLHYCTYSKAEEKFNHVTLDVYHLIKNKKVKVKSLIFKELDKSFSARELDVVRLLNKGYSNQEISEQLSISIFTVKNHKQRLFRKVQVKNTIELLLFARDHSIV